MKYISYTYVTKYLQIQIPYLPIMYQTSGTCKLNCLDRFLLLGSKKEVKIFVLNNWACSCCFVCHLMLLFRKVIKLFARHG